MDKTKERLIDILTKRLGGSVEEKSLDGNGLLTVAIKRTMEYYVKRIELLERTIELSDELIELLYERVELLEEKSVCPPVIRIKGIRIKGRDTIH